MRNTAVRLKWKPLTILVILSIILLFTAIKLYTGIYTEPTTSEGEVLLRNGIDDSLKAHPKFKNNIGDDAQKFHKDVDHVVRDRNEAPKKIVVHEDSKYAVLYL